MTRMEPVQNEPALLLEGEKRTLIAADIHIGIDSDEEAVATTLRRLSEAVRA